MTIEEGGHFSHNNDLGKRADSTFTFSNCKYVIKGKKGTKEILKGISGTVKSGEVLAIIGPSGAGKTMLMNLLTLTPGPGRREGRVTLNGNDLTLKTFKKHFSLVPQVDNHWAYLTCREAIEMATDLQHLYSHEQKVKLVDTLIKEMGLSSCQNTRVGNQFIQGLSGGQKRRLSLAIALVKKPSVILLDEPTSGLDAAAATSIMKFFKDLSVNLNIIIICTIHQPSTKVYNGFDTTMVLTGGQTAYYGPASFLGDYLQVVDRAIPKNSNPAEHVLDLVNREFVDSKEVDYMVEKWNAYFEKEISNPDSYLFHVGKEIESQEANETKELPDSNPEGSPGMLKQITVLFKRHAVLTYRDPILYVGRALTFLFCCTFFSIVYFEARRRKQEQAPYKMFLFMWHIGVPTALGVVAVFSYNLEHVSIKREVKQGMYSPFSYCLANSFLQFPMMFILSIMALTVGGYCVSLYHVPMYLQMITLYACTLWTFECMAQLFAVQFSNPLLGMLQYMNLWFGSFLFAGVMVPEKDVVWPFRSMCYILPLKYFLKSAMFTDFHKTTFSGAHVDATDPRGFSCNDANTLGCYGYYGTQVLDSVGQTYQSISSKDEVAEDFLIILAIGLFFKFSAIFMIVADCMSSMSIHSPKSKPKKVSPAPSP